MNTILACIALLAIDGDSIQCDGVNMRLLGNGTPFVDGVDAPEAGGRAGCRAERMLADRATARLGELLAGAGVKIEDSGKRDRHGRPLVVARLPDGQAAGQVLIEEGLAVVWRSGVTVDWCAAD